jgi:glycerophosphoryl diester phosphodiesterase
MMTAPDWLTARPIAHRGLHDAAHGIIENTPSAITAAIAGNYAIEIDLQVTADGDAMVHHDDALGRLTDGSGPLAAMTAADLKRVAFRATADRMITFGELCDLVGGRIAMFVELKSQFDRDERLVARTVAVLAGYKGPVGVMSFDPRMVADLRRQAPGVVRGIDAERHFGDGALNAWQRCALAHLLHAPGTRPDFVSYRVDDLPAPATSVARRLGVPVVAWTVRTPEQRQRAETFADQMIFEGFRP